MNKEILRLAVPNILSNISIPLISSVDTLLMGQLSAAHIGAVGLGSIIFNMIYWNFGFLRMGTTGVTAQGYGRKDDRFVIHTLIRAIIIALVLAAAVLLLQIPFAQASIYLMNVLPEQTPLVREYIFIRIWAAPATLILYGLFGWYFGMQNAIIPLILTIFINVVNMAVSYYLVVNMQMDIAGVAWGTVVAQYAGLIFGVLFLILKYKNYLQHIKANLIWQLEEFGSFLRINRDIFIRTVCLTFAFAFFYNQSSAGGAMVLAANVILLQFLNWMSYAVDGFGYAAESLVGKYKGADDLPQTRRAINYSFYWGMGLGVLFSVIYGVFGIPIIELFTDEADVVAVATPFLFWMVVLPIAGTPSYIWDGVYIGLTASKAMRNSMLLSLVVYLIVYFSVKNWLHPIHALWLSLVVFLAARGVIQALIFKKKGWKIE